MSDVAAPRRSRWGLLLAPAALLGPAALVLGVGWALDDAGVSGEGLWWTGAWIAAACTGLGIYLAAAARLRTAGTCLLIGAAAAFWVAWVVAHLSTV